MYFIIIIVHVIYDSLLFYIIVVISCSIHFEHQGAMVHCSALNSSIFNRFATSSEIKGLLLCRIIDFIAHNISNNIFS